MCFALCQTVELPCPLRVHHFSPNLHTFTSPETCYFVFFYEGFITQPGLISHWSLVTQLHQRSGGETNSSNLLTTSPQSQVGSKRHLINLRKYTYVCSPHLGNSEGFRSSMSEMGQQPNMYYYKSQYHNGIERRVQIPKICKEQNCRTCNIREEPLESTEYKRCEYQEFTQWLQEN